MIFSTKRRDEARPRELEPTLALIKSRRPWKILPQSSNIYAVAYRNYFVTDIQKVSVALTGEQIAAIKAAVETGEYATTSEIVRRSAARLAVQTRASPGRHQAPPAVVG